LGQLCAVGNAPGWIAGIPDQVVRGNRVPPDHLAVVHPLPEGDRSGAFSMSVYPRGRVQNWSELAPSESLSGVCQANGTHSSLPCADCHACYQRSLGRTDTITLQEGGMYWCLTEGTHTLQAAYLHPDAYHPDPHICEVKYASCAFL